MGGIESCMRPTRGSSKQAEAWQEMLHALRDYKSRHGTCEVPAIYELNPRLGRWVAAQRHKGKCGELPGDRKAALDSIGFSWSPGGNAWAAMFKKLCDYKTEHGHCDVPQDRNGHRDLSAWVQHQRTRRRKGVLEQDRIDRLEKIGFTWSVGRGSAKRIREERDNEVQESLEIAEKLYALGHGSYVQHDGNGQKVEALERYVKQNNGRYPPFIPLPKYAVVFTLGHREIRPVEIAWSGSGDLPDLVMDFVSRNGTLPPYR